MHASPFLIVLASSAASRLSRLAKRWRKGTTLASGNKTRSGVAARRSTAASRALLSSAATTLEPAAAGCAVPSATCCLAAARSAATEGSEARSKMDWAPSPTPSPPPVDAAGTSAALGAASGELVEGPARPAADVEYHDGRGAARDASAGGRAAGIACECRPDRTSEAA
eukprot:6236199-Prymnesium_polylepis.3